METLTIKTCSCGRTFTPDQSHGDSCFRCKVSSVGFGFRGPTGIGRKNFHEHTIKSVIEDSIRHEKANGTHEHMQPVGGKFF